MNLTDWTERKLFNKKSRDISARILMPELPRARATPNRASRREGFFTNQAARMARRNIINSWRRALREPRPDYPILAHCFFSKCKKLPRYNGKCWKHAHE
jgi:hypothetical protein